MYVMKMILLGFFGLAGGAISASGFFAVLTIVGIVNRFAKVTRTAKHIKLYEEMIILGAAIGNVLVIFELVVNIGIIGCAFFGLLSGIFIGSFLVCLAETIKALPIFIRRVRISSGLGYIILFLAIGKGIGSLMYFFLWYPK